MGKAINKTHTNKKISESKKQQVQEAKKRFLISQAVNMSRINQPKSKTFKSEKQPSIYTKRKVNRLNTTEVSPTLENYKNIQKNLKNLNKFEKKKSKVFFFSKNFNEITNYDDKLSLNVNKISKKNVKRYDNNNCTCHLKSKLNNHSVSSQSSDDDEDRNCNQQHELSLKNNKELLGNWYQNKNLNHHKSIKTNIEIKRKQKQISQARRNKANLD